MQYTWLIMLLILAGCADSPPPAEAPLRVDQAMGGSPDQGFRRALEPRQFRFPEDHGPHDGFAHEWWYLTGNLSDEDGRRYGYQVTFFRIALAPDAPQRPSRWAADHVWMVHAALTDASAGRHYARERFSREALGLAGAAADPFRVQVHDWRLFAPSAAGPWKLELASDVFTLAFELDALREPVLQGDAGLSRKSAEPGNASYYYSLTRLRTEGTIQLQDGKRFQVEGLSWLDREWSTSALGPDQAGWDWFALQLSDGTDIMYYRLRRKDGSADPHSRGSALLADGSVVDLGPDEVEPTPVRWWRSPAGDQYPVGWRLRIPKLDLDLNVRPLIGDQLMDLTVEYWEGAIEVLDETGSRVGRGYLELAGYAGAE